MKLSISSKNEYYFYPDIMDNLAKDEKDRFAIVVKKVNPTLAGEEWFKYDENGKYLGLNMGNKYRSQIRRVENAPMLLIDGIEREMTLDDLFNGELLELFPITTGLAQYIKKIENDGAVETKKS